MALSNVTNFTLNSKCRKLYIFLYILVSHAQPDANGGLKRTWATYHSFSLNHSFLSAIYKWSLKIELLKQYGAVQSYELINEWALLFKDLWSEIFLNEKIYI